MESTWKYGFLCNISWNADLFNFMSWEQYFKKKI
jgi:hypothetical protein